MESDRCKTFVRNELTKLGIPYKSVEPGEGMLHDNVAPEKLLLVDIALRNAGLEIMQNK